MKTVRAKVFRNCNLRRGIDTDLFCFYGLEVFYKLQYGKQSEDKCERGKSCKKLKQE